VLTPHARPVRHAAEALLEGARCKCCGAADRQQHAEMADGVNRRVDELDACVRVRPEQRLVSTQRHTLALAGIELGTTGCTKRLHCLAQQHPDPVYCARMQGGVVRMLVARRG
jgi:hypothetical protein